MAGFVDSFNVFAEISPRGIFLIVLGSILLLQILQRAQYEYGPRFTLKRVEKPHFEKIKKDYELTIPKNRSDRICVKCERQLQTYLPASAENQRIEVNQMGEVSVWRFWQGAIRWIRPLFCSFCGADIPAKSNQQQINKDDPEERRWGRQKQVKFEDMFQGPDLEEDLGYWSYADYSGLRSIGSTVNTFGITAEKYCNGRNGSSARNGELCSYMLVNEEDRFRNSCPKCATQWNQAEGRRVVTSTETYFLKHEFYYTPKCCHHCKTFLEPTAKFCFACGEKHNGYFKPL